MRRTTSLALVLSLAATLVAPSVTRAAAGPDRAKITARKQRLQTQKKEAEARAKREVEGGTFRDADLFGKDTGAAIDARTKQLMGRTARRELKALDDAEALLDEGRPDDAAAVLRAWGLNRKATVERAAVARLAGRAQRKTGLLRDGQHDGPASRDDQTKLYFRGGKPLTPAAIYAGPWSSRDDQLVLPQPGTVLELVGLRDQDADGMHPSAVGRDPATGLELKVKLGDGLDVSSSAVVSRVVAAVGFQAPQAAYLMRSLDVSPEIVVASFRHQNKIGVRVREDGVLASMGVRPGKYGHTWFGMDPRQLTSVTMTDGRVLRGDDAIAQLGRAMKAPAAMRAIAHVSLRNVTVETEENAGHAIGPLDLNGPDVRDQRAARGFSIVAALVDAGDVRLSNGHLVVDVKKGKDGAPDTRKLLRVFSDSGSALSFKDPSKFARTVAVTPRGKRVTDVARTPNRTFDRARPEDAAWALSPEEERGLAALTTPQIEAAVAAGVASYPLHRFYVSRLVSRRNAIVTALGLEQTHGLLAEVDAADVSGPGTITLPGDDGRSTTVTLPEGGFRITSGELVRVP